jgi:hypothetical protein
MLRGRIPGSGRSTNALVVKDKNVVGSYDFATDKTNRRVEVTVELSLS